MIFLFGIKCVCFFISFSIIYTSEKKRTRFCFIRKCCISLRDQPERILSWSIFRTTQDQTCITCFLLGLLYGNFDCFYKSFSIISILLKKIKGFRSVKKMPYFLRDRLRRIPSLSIFLNTQDQTSITWVLRDLSLRDKLCLLLHFLFYHIFIREKEITFPFHEKISYFFEGPTKKNPILENLLNQHKKIKLI